MSAAEFLALIEKHPLPWKMNTCCDCPDFRGVVFADADNTLWDGDDPALLCNAAPAMAAAILGVLAEWQCERHDGGYTFHMDALRAALPESLRP